MSPCSYLIITNISKPPNIKSLLRAAVAFGCQKVFVAGQRKFNFDHEADDSDIPTCLKGLLKDGVFEIIKFEKMSTQFCYKTILEFIQFHFVKK